MNAMATIFTPPADDHPQKQAGQTSALAACLTAPAARIALDQLAENWAAAAIEATMPGYGALASDLVAMNRVRGGLGQVLLSGASPNAIAGNPCPWQPPCALDVFFREQGRIGGRHGIPKPWTLAFDRRGQDLIVRITLFGVAIDWAAIMAHGLAQVLRQQIDWKDRAPALFLPKPQISDLRVIELGSGPWPRPRSSVTLQFVTPLDAAGDDPFDRPATVIGRLARRIDLLARWMDVAIEADWPVLATLWNNLDYDVTGLSRSSLPSRSGRDNRRFRREAVEGTLTIAGNLAPIWPLIVIGRLTHAGRGAIAGLGRYKMV